MLPLFVGLSCAALLPPTGIGAPGPSLLGRPAVHARPLGTQPHLLAAVSAFSTATASVAVEDWWIEINKPPIELSPFKVNPAGYLTFVIYIAYLAYTILRPPSEAESAIYKQQSEAAAKAAEESAPFLAAAKSAEGAVVTPSGLVYQETVAGTGVNPTLDNKVVVHYTGTLAEGTVFDSSIARGEPTEFKVKQVIKGWQEGLQMMKMGGKAKLTIPAELAYGPMQVGSIPGNSVLQFEVELIEVKEGGFF